MFFYYNFPETELFVFDEFLICQIREGAEIHPDHNVLLNEIIQKHFSGKNLAYISNRVNSYSVDPLTYVGAEKNSESISHSHDSGNRNYEKKC